MSHKGSLTRQARMLVAHCIEMPIGQPCKTGLSFEPSRDLNLLSAIGNSTLTFVMTGQTEKEEAEASLKQRLPSPRSGLLATQPQQGTGTEHILVHFVSQLTANMHT